MRSSLSTLSLLVALVCFCVALAISISLLNDGNVAVWKDVGWIAIILALLLGRRP